MTAAVSPAKGFESYPPAWQDALHVPHLQSGSSRNLSLLMRLARLAETERDATPTSNSLNSIINRSILRSLLTTLHHRDPWTIRHSRRTAQLSLALAEHLGWEGRNLRLLEVAALLHDIGKVGVPDNILFKPGRLSADELELIALHYNIGLDVLQASRVDRIVLEIISQAQARYGGGDPLKNQGRDAHLGARILSVADAYESMSSQRADRPARSHQEIMTILREGEGTHFDGNVLSALGRCIEMHGLPYAGENPEEGFEGFSSPTEEDLAEADSLCHVFSNLYVMESLYDGFAMFDLDLRTVVWNRGIENLVGQPASQILGRRWTSRLLQYADREGQPLTEDECPMHQVLQTGRPVVREVQLTRHDGRAIHNELQTLPICDSHGQLQGIVEIYRDLTRSGHRRPQEFRDLKLAATRDALTGVANRGELETQLTLLITEFNKEGENGFSVIFADADHFKSVNDTHGHAVGDQVLIDFAQLLQRETYSGELVARYGGEEFVILCPDTTLNQAEKRAERLRNAIRNSRMGGQTRLRVTASLGVAEVEIGDSVESVLRRADKALYTAKQTGRDRTCTLTNAQLLATESPAETAQEGESGLLYTTWFSAVVAADMIIYKLGGYVQDYGARIVEVTADHVLLRQGRVGWLGFWGHTQERQPVEIEVLFSNPLGQSAPRGRSVTKINIGLKIRPLGWVRQHEAFHQRVKRVVREIKHYFAAD